MVALVDNKRVFGDGGRVDLVGIEKVDEFRLGRRSGGGRSETNVIGSGSGSSLGGLLALFAFEMD